MIPAENTTRPLRVGLGWDVPGDDECDLDVIVLVPLPLLLSLPLTHSPRTHPLYRHGMQ
jgi:hypothetical protein